MKHEASYVEECDVPCRRRSPSPTHSMSSTGSSVLFMAPKRRGAVRGRVGVPRA
ncbi:hypothetical protein PISMIDRAFT_679074 [Pisolithus microcarpus 441]|uniref:Uncharacterized protein n=1 Tax=Pisolithus microcarpus 441 TaxID=765257 RepID=A0A0C9YFI4_9AGAM|nr:hypothetical protein PISMIDRAFT_679074 [Pisolithus microcarpus 441]